MELKQSSGNRLLVQQKSEGIENWQWWIGPILTVVNASLLSCLIFFADYRLPTSGAIFVLIVVYAAFKGGFSSVMLSVGLIILYYILELFTPLGAQNTVFENSLRVLIITIIAPTTAWMVARLKSQLERTLQDKLKLEQDYSQELKTSLVKQQQAEEEARRLNRDLEERVKERTAQLEMREELSRKQQQQLQAILDYSPTTINLKDLEGRFLLVNRQIENFFSLDQSQMVGKTSRELLPDGNHKLWMDNDRQVLLTGQPLEIEEEIRLSDGLHTFLSFKFPVRDENGKIFAIGGISTDITERKRLEREAQKLVSLVENTNDFIGIATLDGYIEYINEAGLKLLGLESLDQIKGQPADTIAYPQTQLLTGEMMVANPNNQEQKKGELQFRHFLSGEKIPVLSNIFVIKDYTTGQPLGVAHVAADLREYKQAQEAVNVSQAYLNGVIETSMDAILTVSAKNEIVAFNPAAEKLFGCPASEAMGHPPDRFIPARQRTLYDEYFSQQDLTSEELRLKQFSNPLYAVGAGGIEFPVESTLSSVLVGEEAFYTVFVRDITDRIQAFSILEERVKQRTTELSVLLEISHNVAADFTLQSVKNQMADQLTKLMKFRTFVLYRLEKDGSFSVIGGQSAIIDNVVLQNFTARLHEFSPFHSQAVKTKTTLIVDDVSSSCTPQYEEYLNSYHVNLKTIRSNMYIPLIVKDEVVGLLAINYDEPGYYTNYHAQLAQAIGYQVAVAIENVRLYEQGQQLAALEERQRLARELHDSTSQVLYSLQLGMRALGNFIQRGQMKETTETLAYLIGLAKGGLDEMRLLIFELRPESLEREGLLRALQKQIVALEGRHGLKVKGHFSHETEPKLPLEYKEAIYRIAREALHNVVKHAKADQVDLQLDWDGKVIQLVIKDYGQGFDIKGDFPGHYGLSTMNERVHKLPGGQLDIESEPEQGTKVILKVPFP